MTRTEFRADHALVDGTVHAGVGISVVDGIIDGVDLDATATGVSLRGVVVPGLVNAHSHVFHRALRGRSWVEGDFWTWRDRMYELVERLDPDSFERLATAVFAEMLSSGITAVGEFHYLHHGSDGVRYDDPNEMSMALVRAAETAGIRMCLLDTCYLMAGVDGRELVGPQRRFGDGSVATWAERHSRLVERVGTHDRVTIGSAIHSVRAVPPEAFPVVAESGGPLHVHASEQPAENEACLEHHGVTPIGLLSRTGVLGEGTTVVHAVHVTNDDIELLAHSGTRVCVCPTTELDLGDGTVDTAGLERAGVDICLGSDSHAAIDLLLEARLLEWNARARTGRRGVHRGIDLWSAATTNGASSLGFPAWGITVGAPADFAVIDPDTVRTAGATQEELIGCAGSADVVATYVGGALVAEGGTHADLGDADRLLAESTQGLW